MGRSSPRAREPMPTPPHVDVVASSRATVETPRGFGGWAISDERVLGRQYPRRGFLTGLEVEQGQHGEAYH